MTKIKYLLGKELLMDVFRSDIVYSLEKRDFPEK